MTAPDDSAPQRSMRCPTCGHAPHTFVCLNMASDNDCSCTAPVYTEAEGLHLDPNMDMQ